MLEDTEEKKCSRLGLPSKIRSEKIPRSRLGKVFVILRKKCSFAEFHVSRNIPFRGSERNGEFWEKIKFYGTANITTRKLFIDQKQNHHTSANAIASFEPKDHVFKCRLSPFMYLHTALKRIMPIFVTFIFSCMVWHFRGRFNVAHFHL